MAEEFVAERADIPLVYLLREAAISVAINGVLSAGFFYALFGGRDRILVWGIGNFVFDFLPQGFMVAMMGSLVPGLLARKAWRAGRPMIATPTRVLSWSLQSAITTAAIGTALAGAGLWLAGVDTLPFSTGLIVKIAYGMALATLATPTMLHRVWFSQALPAKVRP